MPSSRHRWFINEEHAPQIDYGTIAGALCAFGLVFLAIFRGGGFSSFFDLNSFLIVIGGTLGATLINFPLEDFKKALAVLRPAFFPDYLSEQQRVHKILELAEKARASGALVLEDEAFREPDPFLKRCIELVVDGLPPQEIRKTLEIELAFLGDRHRRGAQLFQTMGSISPAMGLIGTLIGLVQMLKGLSDPATIGPAMALALLTTFYGSILSNVVFLPISGKLRTRSRDETFVKEITIEGIVEIVQGTNPRLVEQRLFGFLAPEKRESRYS